MMWALFFYGVLTAPVLLVSWYFSEPFFGLLVQKTVLLGVLLLLGVFLWTRFCRCRIMSADTNQYAIMVLMWLGTSVLAACLFTFFPVDIRWVDAFFVSVSGLFVKTPCLELS